MKCRITQEVKVIENDIKRAAEKQPRSASSYLSSWNVTAGRAGVPDSWQVVFQTKNNPVICSTIFEDRLPLISS